MKKITSLTLAVLAGGGFLVELAQALLGFEADTGLARYGNLFLIPQLVLLALWALLVRPLPRDDAPDYTAAFAMTKKELLLPVAGQLLVVLSGAAWLFTGLVPQTVDAIADDGTLVSVAVAGAVPANLQVTLGVLAVAMGLLTLPALVPCLKREEPRAGKPVLLYAAPVLLVVRLVLVYRLNSVDPVLPHYAVELLAVVCLSLSYYRLSGFGCDVGNSRRFGLYAGWAVMLSTAALADVGFPDVLFYLGHVLTLWGLLAARLVVTVPGADHR